MPLLTSSIPLAPGDDRAFFGAWTDVFTPGLGTPLLIILEVVSGPPCQIEVGIGASGQERRWVTFSYQPGEPSHTLIPHTGERIAMRSSRDTLGAKSLPVVKVTTL